jgi:hypothetical protein
LKRQKVRKVTGSEKDPRAEGNENAEHGAKQPRRKKSSE